MPISSQDLDGARLSAARVVGMVCVIGGIPPSAAPAFDGSGGRRQRSQQ
jgi:hypothetical protein